MNRTLAKLLPELRLPEEVAIVDFSGVALDSRQIQPGDIFIALDGLSVKGSQFIPAALAAGAVAVLVESTLDNKAGNIRFLSERPIVAVANLAERVSDISGSAYGNPSEKVVVIGVTGTNGKSTCVSLMGQLHNRLGGQAATLGTLGVGRDGKYQDFGMTTPDAVTCQKLLRSLYEDNIDLVAMEVSSHGLDQDRVSGIHFNTAVLTNITHDHLDYHGELKHYVASKRKLFESQHLSTAVINLDDPFASVMVEAAKKHAKVLTYSLLHFVADIYASDIRYFPEGVSFNVTTPWGRAEVRSPLLGEFNIYNVLAALGALCARGENFSKVVDAIALLDPVEGRMQRVCQANDLMVVVDYAHTPDALKQAIAALRSHTQGELWVVFGCGGDRDRAKRPAMAKIAERDADFVVVTSDNPRSESPEKIIAEICSGFSGSAFHTIVNREEAIYFATQSAKAGDVILLAGKGHEKYQIIGDEKKPFDEVAIALTAMEQRNVALEIGR